MHNPMFDEKGRVWFTSVIRPPDNPAFCKEGSSHPSAKLFPLNRSGRQLAFYDPKSKKFTLIDTCFSTHHLQFAEDANETLWTSSGGGGDAVGWLNVKMFEETHDEQKSQGWTALILDTNGNGKRDAYVEPNQPVDPAKDKRISGAFYGVTVSPADGTIWGSVLGFPGCIVRLNPGSNPPETALAEVYELPWNNPKATVRASRRAGSISTRNGVVWTVTRQRPLRELRPPQMQGSAERSHGNRPALSGRLDAVPLPRPAVEGRHGQRAAPRRATTTGSTSTTRSASARTRRSRPGNGEDALMALVNGKWVTLRVPYPIGFFAKGMDGRIDDPKAGWKGKGLWSTYATRALFHVEGGKGTTSKVLHFQLRPDPLAH